MRPSRSEQATTLLPTNSEMRAPQIRRERMSRPSSSVPHQCCNEGDCRRFGKSMCAGSCGEIQGAKIAANTKMPTSTTPTAASGLWRAMRGSEMARVDMDSDSLVVSVALKQHVSSDAHPHNVQGSRRVSSIPAAIDDEAGGADDVHPLIDGGSSL